LAKKEFSALRYTFSVSSLSILSASVIPFVLGRPPPFAFPLVSRDNPTSPFVAYIFLHSNSLNFAIPFFKPNGLNPALLNMALDHHP